jgi:hypothetical protein
MTPRKAKATPTSLNPRMRRHLVRDAISETNPQ